MERISSRKNPMAIHLRKLGASRAYRDESGEFLCDGIKLLEDAVRSEAEITAVLTASQIPFPLPFDTRVYYADRGLIDTLSPLKNAQETLFTCKIPKICTEEYSSFRIPDSESVGTAQKITGTHILLDGVQDPGNVGTIIRTANAFGIDGVIMTGGCADPYNPKTIRASMGAIFRQSFCNLKLSDLAAMRDAGVRFIATDLSEDSKDIRDADLRGSVIAIGSEGRGLSDEVLALCDARVTIPITAECESLNAAVAAAILMWETARNKFGIRNSEFGIRNGR